MRSLRSRRPALALFTRCLLAQNIAPALAPAVTTAATAAVALAPALALAQADPYKQHMDNGVKLYEDHNYGAAIAEFQAAYEAKPKASPLVNIALCYKAKFNYPKAIETLERALAKHSDTMDAADKQAAASAITDMRALLAYVEVKVSPAPATLFVDDDELLAGATDKPVPLGPGTHRISAHADGFAPAEQTITVASGDKEKIELKLVPDKGWVTVQAPSPRMVIAIDQRPVGTGQWAGMLTPGAHLVQVYGSGGTPFAAQILVIAGKPLNVRAGSGGVPVPMVTVTPPATNSGPRKTPPSTLMPRRQGPYALVLGSLIAPFTRPKWFPVPDSNKGFGAEYGLRAGYQVNSFAGFDLTFQHSNLSPTKSGEMIGGAIEDTSYQIISNHLALGLRLLSAGKTTRFVGSIGGGPVFQYFNLDAPLTSTANTDCIARNKGNPCKEITGTSALLFMETGVEIDLDHVLIDLILEAEFESTGGIGARGEIFDGQPIINFGGGLRVGYRFW